MAVNVKGHGEFGAQFRLHTEQLEHMRVTGGLVRPLFWQAAFFRRHVHELGQCCVGISDFANILIKRRLHR